MAIAEVSFNAEAFWPLFYASLSLQVLIKLQALQLFSIITCFCRYSSLILTSGSFYPESDQTNKLWQPHQGRVYDGRRKLSTDFQGPRMTNPDVY
ncbi:hypothetical protein DKX38_009748 [Salix brachista]|uniref:Uncharacterized protein n=1 Tax=Salix brachista TaxID=2182728 RepID=A0A5N5MBJ3_9ROSI|nr:hypothetical protein DKX38_009748 [Salix brachista]